MNIRDEVRDRLDRRVSDAEIDAAVCDTTPDHLREQITPETELYADIDDIVWEIIDRAFDALQPRVLVVLSDRAILDGSMFDPSSIARFVVEHAADDLRARVVVVLDSWDQRTTGLTAFARSVGFEIAGVSATRNAAYSVHEVTIANVLRGDFARAVVCDPWFETGDERVTVVRRITR